MNRVLMIGGAASTLDPLRAQPEIPEFSVEVAGGAADSLRRLRRMAYSLAFTSPHTSIEEDLALVSEIAELRPGLPTIVLAPSVTRQEVVNALRERVFACFTAPFDWSEIATMVKAAFSGERWREAIQVLSATPDWLSLRVESRLLTVERLVQFMRELASDQPGETRDDLAFAFREVLLNAMEHGTGFDPEQVVEVSAVRTARAIVYHFRDPGPGFQRRDLPHATPSSAPEDVEATVTFREEAGLRPGGFGMLIVRNLVDEVIYNERGNQVILIKHTNGRPQAPA
jgi:anti-sigma regulatory factor (Ser/Thr protein kinase)